MDSQCYNNVMVDAMIGGEALENKKIASRLLRPIILAIKQTRY